jgi:peptidoglycan/LPS O-acetylase OafA/YrhL
MKVDQDRVFGLDLMRAVAISLVLICHGVLFFSSLPLWTALYPYGYIGVELFFVLSGFLIGDILFRGFARSGRVGTLGNFWTRRFLRTLPNYYLFILINVGIAWWFSERLPPIWKYLLFVQYLFSASPGFFGESWSLAIEVWFYLLTPILFFAALKIAPRKFPISTLLIIVATILAVTFLSIRAISHMGVLTVRVTTIYRLDSCMFGMLAAWVKYFHPALFPRGRHLFFIVGIVMFIFAIYCVGHAGRSFICDRSGFVATSLGATMLLPLLDSWRAVPPGGTIVPRLSLWAYSLYLANTPVRRVIQHLFFGVSPYFKAAVFLFVSFVVAESVYSFYEKPMMNLRDRWPFRGRTVAPASSAENQTAGI